MDLTPQQRADLEVARALVRAGVPLFLGRPDPGRPTGFALPPGWERSSPDESVVDAWRPGWALCAVTGHVLDLVDLDPRSGGNIPTVGSVPSLGRAATPSGGTHLWVAPLGIESRDGAWPGVDVKSGAPDGRGRGFGFLPPTERASKADGRVSAYRWEMVPLGGSVRDAAHVAHTVGVHGGLAEVRQRVVDLRAARAEGGEPRRLARSAAAAEWDRALARLEADVRRWAATGWGGEAHASLLEATRHLVMLSPEHAEGGYLEAFRRAGVEPDEADLAKLESALDKYAGRADVVVPDEELGPDEWFWTGQAAPPPFGAGPGSDRDAAPPGTFDFVTPERVRGRAVPVRPTLGAFGGGRPLFYDRGVHWLQGESESGKSWVALALAAEVLAGGGLVLYADHEDTEGPVLERLEQLGVTEERFGQLVYVAATDVPHAALVDHLATSGRDYALLVVDGVTSALTAAGLSGRDEQELTAWADVLPRRVRMAVCVDHVVKAVDERRGMAVGTQAKKSVVTGSSFEVACLEKWGRGGTGELVLRPQKDKRGGVRALIGDRGVRLRFSSDPETGAVTLLVPSASPAEGRDDGHAEAWPEVQAMAAFLEGCPNARAEHSLRHLVAVLRDNNYPTTRGKSEPAVRLFKHRAGVPTRLDEWVAARLAGDLEAAPDGAEWLDRTAVDQCPPQDHSSSTIQNPADLGMYRPPQDRGDTGGHVPHKIGGHPGDTTLWITPNGAGDLG